MTMQDVLIRDERNSDHTAISNVTVAAFEKMEISNHTEQFIIEALRASKALTISLVAEIDRRIVGHIAFSPVTLSDGTQDWYGLGPVSVHPDFQHKGIGKALIQEGLARLTKLNAKGCCLVGHPEYYPQFGFRNVEGLFHEGVPQEVFFVLSFDRKIPHGKVMFHEGFKADGQQVASTDANKPRC
jgi:putative acetyltransferase